MKKLKSLKSKIVMFLFALVLPLSASALTLAMPQTNTADADSSSTTYSNGYTKELTLSNSNFNSVSTYSISTSLTGWTGLNNNKTTTAGIINTGNSFQNYMTNTYRLAKNPNAKAVDKHILMINSKTSNSTSTSTARQGFKSNTVSLSANSYYSFQVSYKNDTNYESETTYQKKGVLAADQTISTTNFKNAAFGEYVSFSHSSESKTRYVQKTITATGNTLGEDLENVTFFYEDDEYAGLVHGGQALYVKKADVETIDGADNTKTHNVASATQTYTCNINYSNNTYKIAAGNDYFESTTSYNEVDHTVFGSMYLSGLKDENGKPVKAEFVKVTSKEWVTFYFFVATGSTSQSVTLDLWLGASTFGMESSGVAFFDDVHVYQYSENKFWQTYNLYHGRDYNLEIEDSNGNVETETVECVNLIDMRSASELKQNDSNFDFEAGIFNDTAVKNWTVEGSKKAQVFNTNSPETFKRTTGYDYVGSTLSCDVELEDDLKATIYPNNYVLGLWANNDYVSVKSQNIDVNANQIVKITANYKISDLTSGNVYMLIEENNSRIAKYNLSEGEYTLTSQTASSAVKDNGSDEFNNKYGKIEFFVKGSSFFNSSINFSLALGKNDESATGCVVFDDVKVESVSSEAYNGATNKVALDARTFTSTIPNANFNNTTVSNDKTYPLSADSWTITKGSGYLYGGVINTETAQYDTYRQEYLKDAENVENPYIWAKYKNPGNSAGLSTDYRPDNVLMLANFSDSWQKLNSSSFEISANTAYNLSFSLKTFASEKVAVRIYGSDGFKLYEKTDLSSNGSWKTFEIFLKSFAGADTLTIELELDGIGAVYFDAFELNTVSNAVFEAKESNPNDSLYGIVNMDNFYFNIPTNNFTDSLYTSTSPAYKGSLSSGTAEGNVGAIVDSSYLANKEIFNIDETNKNVFFITNQGVGSYTIQSNFNFDLAAGEYYKLSFKLKTNYAYLDTNSGKVLDDKKTYENGVTIGLTGFDYITKLSSNDDYETFTMYFKSDEAATAQLYIAFISDYAETVGSMAIYDVEFATSDEETYTQVKTTTSSDTYDINTDKVFVATAEEAPSDEPEDPDTDTDTPAPTEDNSYAWLAVPTIITGVAIVLAIIAFAMRKVKLKKIEKKRTESYDRKSSLNIDRIKSQAKKQRDEEVSTVEKTLNTFESELERLEIKHKQKVVELRAKDKGKVSKETDKEFKSFAQKRAVVAEKVESLKKQIEDLKSAEHLLAIERKLFAQEEMKRKELLKASKQANKINKKSK